MEIVKYCLKSENGKFSIGFLLVGIFDSCAVTDSVKPSITYYFSTKLEVRTIGIIKAADDPPLLNIRYVVK